MRWPGRFSRWVVSRWRVRRAVAVIRVRLARPVRPVILGHLAVRVLPARQGLRARLDRRARLGRRALPGWRVWSGRLVRQGVTVHPDPPGRQDPRVPPEGPAPQVRLAPPARPERKASREFLALPDRRARTATRCRPRPTTRTPWCAVRAPRPRLPCRPRLCRLPAAAADNASPWPHARAGRFVVLVGQRLPSLIW